jgi:phospholipid/cholesterol/gamma-HCH transport system substrate-binding protein
MLRLRRQIERYWRWLISIGILAAAAVAAGSYILVHQRLSLPWQERYPLRVEFASAGAVTPGLGQPVSVAGVKVGTVVGSELRDGRAIVSMEIDPAVLPRVYTNARAVLRPNTPLKDMQVDIFPGRPPGRPMPRDGIIPIARTEVPIDSDELLSALDADTREFFQILVTGADVGTAGRGRDIRQLLRALGPTTAQIRELGDALAARRVAIARLVHNLSVLSGAVSGKDREVAQAIVAADATLRAVSSEDAALRDSLAQLPPTLAAARRSLDGATGFANELGPALNALMPAARRLPGTLRAVRPLVTEAEPILHNQLRPLVRETTPLVRDLTPATYDLTAVTPELTNSFKVLRYVANELVYNPPGDNEGFLFWLAWFAHNADSVFSTQDAHGPVWRGLGLFSCTALAEPELLPLLVLLETACPEP